MLEEAFEGIVEKARNGSGHVIDYSNGVWRRAQIASTIIIDALHMHKVGCKKGIKKTEANREREAANEKDQDPWLNSERIGPRSLAKAIDGCRLFRSPTTTHR